MAKSKIMKIFSLFLLLLCLAESFKIYVNQSYPDGVWVEYFKFDSHLGTTFNQDMPYYLDIPIPVGSTEAYVNVYLKSEYDRGLQFRIKQKTEDYLRANMTWICPKWKFGIAFTY
jgi:hypothetical protein